jgi:ketosteroid isomerase-like protein
MTQEQNLKIAQTIFGAIGAGEAPETIAQHFSEDVAFEIQGDDGVLPWIGRHVGRQSIVDFLRGTREKVTQESVNVEDLMASDNRAIAVGSLSSIINATQKRIKTDFAFVMTVSDGLVTRFQMFEDSFAVSAAARP